MTLKMAMLRASTLLDIQSRLEASKFPITEKPLMFGENIYPYLRYASLTKPHLRD